MLVLVVDDNPDTCEYIEACLDANSYEVISASDGKTALQRLGAQQPDAVLLDLSLPDMDGLRVCRAIKSDSLTTHIPVLILTINSDHERFEEAFNAGADDYLVKPFDERKLDIRLRARIRKAKSQASTEWSKDDHESLISLTRLLASSLDLSELLHLVAVKTAEVLRVDRCAVMKLSPQAGTAEVLASSEDASVHGITLNLSKYPEIHEVITTHRPLVVNRVEEHPTLHEILPIFESKGIGSIALFPILSDEKIEGVLFMRSTRFDRELSEKDMFFASSVAGSVALALRNVDIANELRQTKQFIEAMIDSSVDAIMAADVNGSMMLFNKGAERLTGYAAEEVIGKMNITSFYPPGVAHEVMQMLREDRNGGVGRLTSTRKEILSKSGEVIPVLITAWSVTEMGKEVATAGIFTDLRDRLRIERKLSQAQEKLMHTEQQAVIAELAGATAHELNQPLTSVLGYAEMAKRKIGDDHTIARIIETIISEAERMADIVRKIGRITKYETKSYVGGQRIVDLDKSSEPE